MSIVCSRIPPGHALTWSPRLQRPNRFAGSLEWRPLYLSIHLFGGEIWARWVHKANEQRVNRHPILSPLSASNIDPLGAELAPAPRSLQFTQRLGVTPGS